VHRPRLLLGQDKTEVLLNGSENVLLVDERELPRARKKLLQAPGYPLLAHVKPDEVDSLSLAPEGIHLLDDDAAVRGC